MIDEVCLGVVVGSKNQALLRKIGWNTRNNVVLSCRSQAAKNGKPELDRQNHNEWDEQRDQESCANPASSHQVQKHEAGSQHENSQQPDLVRVRRKGNTF